MNKRILSLVIITAVICCTNKGNSQLLQPDSSYGFNGRAFFPNAFILARVDAAMQPDGKVLLASNGRNTLTNETGFITVRFTENGQPDLSFGNNGIALTALTPFSQQATKVALQKDNKIITGGWAVESNNEMAFALVRYLPTGQPDISFGINGKVITNFRNGENENMQGMSLQDNGKILTCGYSFETNSEIVIARYTNSGQPDTSFNHTGYMFLSLSPFSYQAANTIIGLPDGKILLGGVYRQQASSSYESILLRLNSNGSIDSSFGVNGKVSTLSSESFIDLKRRPDGTILALGFRSLVRYTADGIPDNSFGTGNGEVIISSANFLNTMQVAEDGSIFITGWSSADTDFIIYKLSKNGAIDNSFGVNGQLTFPAGAFRDRSYTLMQRAGRIYLGGSAESVQGGSNRFAVIKLLNKINSNNPFFRIFPNPTASQIFIETDTDIWHMSLYNSIGQLAATWNKNERQLDLNRLAADVYTIKVMFINGRTITAKIVKAQ